MSWQGSSNIGASGFTIDMQKINTVSVSGDQKVVSIGAGSNWRNVYHSLAPYNLTTVGGRTSDVGVAGFLLGGLSIYFRNLIPALINSRWHFVPVSGARVRKRQRRSIRNRTGGR